MTARRSLVVVSGDPGATTGLVAVRFRQFVRDGSPMWMDAEWLGHATVTRPGITKTRLRSADCDMAFAAKLLTALSDLTRVTIGTHRLSVRANIAVLEEPLDGSPAYAADGSSKNRRDTAFRLGASYGLLMAALRFTGHPPNAVYSYPVRTLRDRAGWMARSTRPDELAASKRVYAAITQTPIKSAAISEHCLMALGVLRYWVSSSDAIGAAEHAVFVA